MNNKYNTKTISRQGLIAAIYVIATLSVGEFAYGPIQFRYAEFLNLLAFYNPLNILGVTVGVFVSNLWSIYPLDLIFGTLHSFIALIFVSKSKNIWIASLWPAIFSFIIGFEIVFFTQEPLNFWLITGQIMLSELIIVTLVSVPIYKGLEKNKSFMTSIGYYDIEEI